MVEETKYESVDEIKSFIKDFYEMRQTIIELREKNDILLRRSKRMRETNRKNAMKVRDYKSILKRNEEYREKAKKDRKEIELLDKKVKTELNYYKAEIEYLKNELKIREEEKADLIEKAKTNKVEDVKIEPKSITKPKPKPKPKRNKSELLYQAKVKNPHSGREILLDKYATKEEAEEAEKRALEALL